jgi:hypothetical protein
MEINHYNISLKSFRFEKSWRGEENNSNQFKFWGKLAQENESFVLTISKDPLRSAAF